MARRASPIPCHNWMTDEHHTPKSSGNGRDDSSQTGRRDAKKEKGAKPRGFFFVAALLLVLLGIASLTNPGDYGVKAVETREDLIVKYLLEERLDPKTLVFLEDTLTFRADFLAGKEVDGTKKVERKFENDDIVTAFRQKSIDVFNSGKPDDAKIDWRREQSRGVVLKFVMGLLPWVLIIVVFYFLFFRQLRSPGGPGGNILSFGKSRARLAGQESTGITFADVAGIEEAKGEVTEIVEFLKNPQKFQRLGGRIPHGVMLVGHPGTGKTLLAKAIAGEAEVPFFSICGSDFVEMFVGVGAARVRDLFKQARESSPCIVFLDEVDAVGRRRGSGLGGGHDEREQTLNAILVEMDGFDSEEGIILIAATNRPDVLDPALLRPGRFDRQITIDLPDVEGREQILRVHSRKIEMDSSVDLHRIARGTPTFSGAELAALVNEGAIIAAMKEQSLVQEVDLEEARDKIRYGRQKTSRVMVYEDRLITAYHEAGHALVAHLLPEVEPLHKVSIVPRGMALGLTMQLPERDRYHMTRKQVLGNLKLLYAGRVAEEKFCDDITSGASNDIERATELARRMVCEWGMSDEIGPIKYTDNEETLFLGREVTKSRDHSESLARRIDDELRKVVDGCYQAAEELVEAHREAIERITQALLVQETLTGSEVAALVSGETIEDLQRKAAEAAEEKKAAAGKQKTSPLASPRDDPEEGLSGDTPGMNPDPLPAS